METLSPLLYVTIAVVTLIALALLLADSLLLFGEPEEPRKRKPSVDMATGKKPTLTRPKDENELIFNNVGNNSTYSDPGSLEKSPDKGERVGGWKCACEGGGLFLPPSMMKSICGPSAAFSLSAGRCYHKQM